MNEHRGDVEGRDSPWGEMERSNVDAFDRIPKTVPLVILTPIHNFQTDTIDGALVATITPDSLPNKCHSWLSYSGKQSVETCPTKNNGDFDDTLSTISANEHESKADYCCEFRGPNPKTIYLGHGDPPIMGRYNIVLRHVQRKEAKQRAGMSFSFFPTS